MSHIHNFEPNGRCRCGEHIALVPHRATMTDDTPMDLTLEDLRARDWSERGRTRSAAYAGEEA